MLSFNDGSALLVIQREYPRIVSTSITRAVKIYAVGKQGEMMEVATSICLLGAPVGSQAFAEAFLLEAMNKMRTDSAKLHAKIIDLQTRLFKQCMLE